MPNRPAVVTNLAARTVWSSLLQLTPLQLLHAVLVKLFEVSLIH
jgi:hypothetical protein